MIQWIAENKVMVRCDRLYDGCSSSVELEIDPDNSSFPNLPKGWTIWNAVAGNNYIFPHILCGKECRQITFQAKWGRIQRWERVKSLIIPVFFTYRVRNGLKWEKVSSPPPDMPQEVRVFIAITSE